MIVIAKDAEGKEHRIDVAGPPRTEEEMRAHIDAVIPQWKFDRIDTGEAPKAEQNG